MAKYVKFSLALLVLIIILILVFYHRTYTNCQITVPPRYYNIQHLSNPSHAHNTTNKPYKLDNQTNYSIPDLWVSYRDKWVANKALVKIDKKQVILDSNYQLAMHSKGYHPLVRSNERFRARLDRFYRYCSTFNTKNANKLSLVGYYQMLFNDKYELLQCVTQKVASSHWVKIFILLYGEKPEDYFNRASPIGGDDILWKKISLNFNLNNNNNITSKRFQTYTKLLIVRHPFAKILSAYKNKFKEKSWWFIEHFAPQIIKVNHLKGFATNENEFRRLNQSKKFGLTKEREEFILNQIRRLKPNGLSEYRITFHEFLVYLVSYLPNNRLAMDHHWGVISLYCNPCSVIYDVIAKYETLFEDTSDILQYITKRKSKSNHKRLDEIVKANVQPYATTKVCNNEFRAIPLWLKRKLYMVYREDFLMFGYPYDESLLQDHACRVN